MRSGRHPAACALLLEQHDEWAVSRRYRTMGSLAVLCNPAADPLVISAV
ncbi:hypothetical protein FHS63_006273 [Azospirillum doebereinerae]